MSDLTDELAAEAEAEESARPPATLENLEALASEVNVIDSRMEKGRALLKELGERRNQILGRDMVEMMDRARVGLVAVDGRKFEVKPYYHASIPEEHLDAGHDWLEAHEAGDLIKYQLIVTFPKESEEEVAALRRYITERYQMADVATKRQVPWARLTSWLKDLFENQDEKTVLPPLDIMGATVGRVVKIKEPKAS